jgi:hypothetical protein
VDPGIHSPIFREKTDISGFTRLRKLSFSAPKNRVARWYIFKPKIPIWLTFGGPWRGKVLGFYNRLEYVTAIWYNL